MIRSHAIVVFLAIILASSDALFVSPLFPSDVSYRMMTTLAASRRGGPQNGATKKKKRKGPANQKNKKGNDPKSSLKDSSSQKSRAAQMNNKKKQASHAPPWQVVSKKDMAKNIRAEKQRRKLAQEQGIHNAKDNIELRISKNFLTAEDKAIVSWKRFAQSPQDEIDFIGAYLEKQLPPRLGAPEVAFLGRSNVGKSSLLNKLVGSDTARVGKTPGATASVNLYGMFRRNKALLGLVDLPGFGYAKLSKENKEAVQQAAENYLAKRKELMLGILLVDIRRKPSDDDKAVLAALFDMGVPIIVVATKVDKLSKAQIEDALHTIQTGLGLPEGQPFSVSSVTGQGIKELWRIIMEVCEAGVDDFEKKLEKGTEASGSVDRLEADDEIAYSQGFDWIHDSASVMYEGEEGDYMYEDFEDDEGEYYYEDEVEPIQRETMKDLKKKAKEMEKRGEL